MASALLLVGALILARELEPRAELTALTTPAAVVELPRVAPPSDSRLPIMITTRDVPRGAVVDADALRVMLVDALPAPDAIQRADDAQGRVALERILPGQILTAAMLTAQPANAGLGPLVPENLRATTLRLAEDVGVGYLVRPGDRVDVLLVTRDETDDGPNQAGRPAKADLARMVLQDVQVLAIGDQLGAEQQPGPAGRQVPPMRNATLALSPQDVLLLGLARADGGFALALRNPNDRTVVPLPRLARAELLGREPMPEPPLMAMQAPAPRLVRAGPEIIRGAGAARGNR